MYMAYTTNPHLPKVRARAVRLYREGQSLREVARYTGYHYATISKWAAKCPLGGVSEIPTKSSRPHHHPHALAPDMVRAIVARRLSHGRCAEVVHEELAQQHITVSLSSVKRILERHHLIKKRSPWKRYHAPMERPIPLKPGDLAQIDSIHVVPRIGMRFYVYTLLDVYSRWAYASVSLRLNTHRSLRFVREAQRKAPFQFTMIQSDHGQEFSTYFTEQVKVVHRHSRVRKPNDNAHLERFNRTIQDECLSSVRQESWAYQKAIQEYLPYYNEERLHLGINLKTPIRCCQAID